MHNQPSFAKRMLKNGALGYVTKSSNKNEMFEALVTVTANKIYVCKEIQENLSKQLLVDDDTPDISKLSEREIDVLKHIKDGLSSKEIAEKLFLSARTVEVHRSNILKKLNLKNTASLLKFIHNSSLVCGALLHPARVSHILRTGDQPLEFQIRSERICSDQRPPAFRLN